MIFCLPRCALSKLNTRLLAVVTAGFLCVTQAGVVLDDALSAAAQRYGAQVVAVVQTWVDMLEGVSASGDDEKLVRVNDFFNRRIGFDDDQHVWQQSDYWATPLETLARGAGDCEDFAIAKYTSLRKLGIPAEKLRLIYVRAQIGGPHSALSQAHMVLGYYPEALGEPLILDNLVGEVLPASRRTDLFPVFSFNADGLWVGGAASPAASATARLSRWRDVLARMRAEGFE